MENRSNSILAFIPQNKSGELVLKQALYFQQIIETRIFVLKIIKSPSLLFQKIQTKKMDKLKTEAKQELSNFIKNVIRKDIPKNIILKIKFGDVVSTLIHESKKGGYDFIIVDKSKSSFKGTLYKGKFNKFISQSQCPVLTINKDFPIRKIKKIIIPIDISQTTKKRLLWATLFAKKFNAKILIVSTLNAKIEKTKSLAYKNAEKIKGMLTERGVDCDVKILKTDNQKKHEVILKYIDKEKPELVIIRTHQESIFAETHIGKFVSKIVHGCKMPVFTVN